MNNTKGPTTSFVCIRFPPKMHSLGIWGHKTPLTYSVPTLELQMVTIFGITQLFHFPLRRLGIPKLLSEIIAGVILGSTFLGGYKKYRTTMFPMDSQGVIGPLAAFGYMLFMFLSGVNMDISMIKKTGGKAWVIGLLNALCPLVIGLFCTHLLVGSLGNSGEPDTIKSLPTIVVTHSVTAFPVIAFLLKDLKILNSELGRLALSSTLISYLVGVFNTAVTTVINIARNYTVGRAVGDIVLCVIFVLLVIFTLRPAMVWVAKQTPEGRPVKELHSYLIILAAFLSCVFSQYFEQTALFGPFIIGLAVPDGPPLGSTLIDKLDSFASGVFLPLFVSITALTTNLRAIDITPEFAVNNVILLIVTFLAKIVGCLVPALYCKMPFNDALALALIMSAKGAVDLASYSFLRDSRILNQEIFALMVVATAFNAALVPVLVKRLYDPSRKYAGYQKRNIMHSKHNGKLPILACIHRPDNIAALLKLLDATSPSTEHPIAVNVLHLIELRGRASPVFISHQVQKKTVANLSYSEDVILAFSQYERNNWGAVTVHAFTAISPRKLMQEDICTLALDTLASIIIIPFHRQWAIDGSVEAEDHGLRTLNHNVLDRAPCSIGILVDRGHLRRSNSIGSSEKSYNVAMIFFGGNDDQEALIYAKRMARKSSITLTVVHLTSTASDEDCNEKEKILDAEVLNDVKLNNVGNGYVKYAEQTVKDGPETALVVRAMVHEHDLIIVGRRHNVESPQTSGLEVWSEFPELGIIGDLLASSDIKGKASVLVVQQQQINH